ncbi:hypothetical protein NC651_000355 [Populus alba x Populus x berolinensis]|nr:hypothetical protein NC651_000355 [Populus alba x Populus x berolinensis]
MDEIPQSSIFEGEITGIRFGLASQKEICTASISDCPISHSIQLTNPFLGLPLEFGKCESCGTSEPGQCEGHFGYIDLPVPIYHPSHISELKRMLSLLCLKCLKLKRNKIQIKSNGVAERLLSCCEVSIEVPAALHSICRDMHYCMLCLLILNRRNALCYCINIIHKQACFKLLPPLSDCFVECLPLYLLRSHFVSTVLSSLTFTFIAYYLDKRTNNCSLYLEEEKIGL